MVVDVRPRAQLPTDDAGRHRGDQLVKVLLQEERLVLQERLDHAHQVDEDGQVVLHHVHAHPLRDEGAESRQHLGFCSALLLVQYCIREYAVQVQMAYCIRINIKERETRYTKNLRLQHEKKMY